tara:strand:+ start:330 stop:770 length:441 start_codon:yes stop_codon:yes gene_type:complete
VIRHLNMSRTLQGRLARGEQVTVDDAILTKALSDRVRARYGPGHVHCMLSMHSMRQDFVRCAKQYRRCGGAIADADLEDDRIMAAIKDGERFAITAHKAEENRASCKDMFDRETLAAVQNQEGDIIRQFELGGCCTAGEHKFWIDR